MPSARRCMPNTRSQARVWRQMTHMYRKPHSQWGGATLRDSCGTRFFDPSHAKRPKMRSPTSSFALIYYYTLKPRFCWTLPLFLVIYSTLWPQRVPHTRVTHENALSGSTAFYVTFCLFLSPEWAPHWPWLVAFCGRVVKHVVLSWSKSQLSANHVALRTAVVMRFLIRKFKLY